VRRGRICGRRGEGFVRIRDEGPISASKLNCLGACVNARYVNREGASVNATTRARDFAAR
jgi:NADH:ubiquinone oxidoreductase subunit E